MGWVGWAAWRSLFTVTTADVVLQYAEQSSITMNDGKDGIVRGSGSQKVGWLASSCYLFTSSSSLAGNREVVVVFHDGMRRALN
ncbi:hypothetical protein ACH3XW_13795 [Acanthocheilonema viteae]